MNISIRVVPYRGPPLPPNCTCRLSFAGVTACVILTLFKTYVMQPARNNSWKHLHGLNWRTLDIIMWYYKVMV